MREIEDFLGQDPDSTDVLVFDLETNGFAGTSVLSCGGLVFRVDWRKRTMRELRRFERFYYPVEDYNLSALNVNGLYEKVIREARGNCGYAKHFSEDEGFIEFARDIDKVVGHNISFDMQFIPSFSAKKTFCTMRSNRDRVAAGFMAKYGAQKYPKLSETAAYYGVNHEQGLLHGALYDAEVTARIFEKMLQSP